MAFDFPNSPTPGSVYSPAGGPSYTWDGQKWVMTGSAITYTPAYDQRNRIVNPAMQISQENGSTLVTTVRNFPVDQFQIDWIGPVFSAQKVSSPTEWRLRCICTTAKGSLAAGDFAYLYQWIEGIKVQDFAWGTASGLPVVLRFGWKSPAGTYSVSINRADAARSFIATFTISAAQANTDTIQTIAIPGDTTAGTWVWTTAKSFLVCWNFAYGSTYNGTTGWQAGNVYVTSACSNGAATVNNTFEVWNVGLYLDPTSSGIAPAWEMPDEASELAACQRYWQTNYPPGTSPGASTATFFSASSRATTTTTTDWLGIPFPVSMRAAPTMTVYPIDGSPSGSMSFNGTELAAGIGGQYQYGWLVRTTAGTFTANNAVAINGNWVANARM